MKNFTVNTITWHKQTPKICRRIMTSGVFSLFIEEKRCLLVFVDEAQRRRAFLCFLLDFDLLYSFFSRWNTDTEKRKWAKEISGLFGNLKLCEKNYVWSAFRSGLVLRRAVWWLLTWLREIKREFSTLVISFDCCCAKKELIVMTRPFLPDTMEIVIKLFGDWLRVICCEDKTKIFDSHKVR